MIWVLAVSIVVCMRYGKREERERREERASLLLVCFLVTSFVVLFCAAVWVVSEPFSCNFLYFSICGSGSIWITSLFHTVVTSFIEDLLS